MMRWIWLIILLGLCWVLPTYAFVSKLHPAGGPIPCHMIRAALTLFIDGTFSGAQLATALETNYAFVFSAADQTDNTNTIALLNAAVLPSDKLLLAFKTESLCVAWEEGFTAVSTANQYRTLLGIATQ